MRLFQNAGIYPAYLPRLMRLRVRAETFSDMLDIFMSDRYGACHTLLPILEGDPSAFFTNGDDEQAQRRWAAEHGLNGRATLEDILLAQIEEHRPDVFYNLDPMRYGNSFLSRLPSCVRHRVAWRAAPSSGGDFHRHDVIVCNFPGIIETYRKVGARSEYFAPAHDPEMDSYAAKTHRPLDILFVGGFTRHHRQRAEVLLAMADLRVDYDIRMHLDRSRLTRLADSPIGILPALRKHRSPRSIRKISAAPVFGRELYETISSAKIVLNGAVDMAGRDRGNMRCFEAMGCGSLMVSDTGSYPPGFEAGGNFVSYTDADDAVRLVRANLEDTERRQDIARRGHELVKRRYSKSDQWRAFRNLVDTL